MAILIQDEAQVKACEEINSLLAAVSCMNEMLKTDEPYAVTTRKRRTEVDAECADKIKHVLKSMRQKRIKEITAKAAKFRIALSEDEKAAISDLAIN